MKILLINPNFPGSFGHIVEELLKQGHQLIVMTIKSRVPDGWKGVRIINYQFNPQQNPQTHQWLQEFDNKVRCGEQLMHLSIQLKASGFNPDVIIANPSLGEALFIRDVWPNVPLGIHCEMYLNHKGQMLGFDREFEAPQDESLLAARTRMSNSALLMQIEQATAGIAFSNFQAESFPSVFQPKISIIHEGVDTQFFCPNENVEASLACITGRYEFFRPASSLPAQMLNFSRNDEIITFVNRNFEPARGCHKFIRILPQLLQRRTRAHVIMAGVDGQTFSHRPTGYESWRQQFWREVETNLSPDAKSRIHFVGMLPKEQFAQLLQLSTVHVYLSYPLVNSASLIEAMSCGCAIVASNVAPVREIIENGQNGVLVDFFDSDGLVERIVALLKNSHSRQQLSMKARMFAKDYYDRQTQTLPKTIKWIERLADSST